MIHLIRITLKILLTIIAGIPELILSYLTTLVFWNKKFLDRDMIVDIIWSNDI